MSSLSGSAQPVRTMADARQQAQAFADRLGLKVAEVMQFTNNSYARLDDKSGKPADALCSPFSAWSGLVVHHGEAPTEPGEFAGNGDRNNGGAHSAAFLEMLPPLVQAPSGLLGAGFDFGSLPGSASLQLQAGPVGLAVMPRRFHQQPAGVAVAGLGDRPHARVSGRTGALTGQARDTRRSSHRSTSSNH